jgi:hypothetical protein
MAAPKTGDAPKRKAAALSPTFPAYVLFTVKDADGNVIPGATVDFELTRSADSAMKTISDNRDKQFVRLEVPRTTGAKKKRSDATS